MIIIQNLQINVTKTMPLRYENNVYSISLPRNNYKAGR